MAKMLKSNWKKGLKSSAISSSIRGGAAVGTAWLSNETIPAVFKIGESNPEKLATYHKYKGAGLFLLGILGQAALADEKMANVAQGMATYGALDMAGNLVMPNRKKELGLAGVEDLSGPGSEVVDWETIRTQVSGLGANDPLADINATLESSLQKTITGVDGFSDDPDRGNWAPVDQVAQNAASAAAGGAGAGASLKANPNVSVNGFEDID